MPARRKSLAELERSGALRKDPQRYRERFSLKDDFDGRNKARELGWLAQGPEPDPIGGPPSDFLRSGSSTAAMQLEAWNDVMAMAPPYLLLRQFQSFFEIVARVLAETRRPNAKNGWFALLARLLEQGGMAGPDSRRKFE